MRSIYLDSNILIAYYSSDKQESHKKQMVQRALDVFAKARDVWLCTSIWAVTEMVKILASSKKMNPADVAEVEQLRRGHIPRGAAGSVGSRCR